jgi:hypothetical protein
MSPLLHKVLNELDQLTPDEQLQVMGHLANRLRNRVVMTEKQKRSWQELEGVAPNLMKGADAQVFVNQLRDEWDERENQLRQI